MDRRRILVIDDDAGVREAVVGALEDAGYEVEERAVGAGSVERARAFRPDLVLLDLVLPDADGSDLLEPLRAACPGSRVVAFTGYFRTLEEVREESPGFDGYLLKPMRSAKLIQELEAILGSPAAPKAG